MFRFPYFGYPYNYNYYNYYNKYNCKSSNPKTNIYKKFFAYK